MGAGSETSHPICRVGSVPKPESKDEPHKEVVGASPLGGGVGEKKLWFVSFLGAFRSASTWDEDATVGDLLGRTIISSPVSSSLSEPA